VSPAGRLLSFSHRSVTQAAVLEGSMSATSTVRFPRSARLEAPLRALLGAGSASGDEDSAALREVPMAAAP